VAKQFIFTARLFESRSAAWRCRLCSRTIGAAAKITSRPRFDVPHRLVGGSGRELTKYSAIVRHLAVCDGGFARYAVPGVCIKVHNALTLEGLALAAAEARQHQRIGHVSKRSVEVGGDTRALKCGSVHQKRARHPKADLKNH